MPLGIQEESYERDILGLLVYCASSRAHLLEEVLKCFFCATICVTIFMAQKKKENIVHLWFKLSSVGVHLPRSAPSKASSLV